VSQRHEKRQEPTIRRWRGALVALAGWAVPGLGHLLLHRWGKALAYFLCVGTLAMAGLIMHGEVFGSSVTDIFDRLGFLADLGAGGFYVFAQSIWHVIPDMAHASGDYGTRMFAAAGVLNLLAVLEAFEIGSGQRT
jgi:hypothetical protein